MAEVYLRKADESDMDLLFDWANDDTVRENAFNTEKIPYDEHKKWFENKLNSDSSVIYIYCQGDTPIGQARIDIDDGCGLISYSVDSRHRLRGHGETLLALLEATVAAGLPEVKVLVAQVKKTNIASQRKFEQRMYEKADKDGYFEYRKNIELLR